MGFSFYVNVADNVPARYCGQNEKKRYIKKSYLEIVSFVCLSSLARVKGSFFSQMDYSLLCLNVTAND